MKSVIVYEEYINENIKNTKNLLRLLFIKCKRNKFFEKYAYKGDI